MRSEKTNKEEQFEEIDLKYLKDSIFLFLDNLGFAIYKLIKNLLKKWYYFLIAIIIGCSIGFFKEQREEIIAEETVEYTITVSPKYESIDYLKRLVATNFKGEYNTQSIRNTRLESIEDIYNFIGEDGVKAAIFGNLNTKFEKADEGIYYDATAKNYHFQELTIEVDSDFKIDLFLKELKKYLIELEYFKERKEIGFTSLLNKREELQNDLKHVNDYLAKIGEENQQLQETVDLQTTLEAKRTLLEAIEKNKIELLEGEDILFVANYLKNEESNDFIEEEKRNTVVIGMIKYTVLMIVLSLVIIAVSSIIKKYKIREAQ